MSSKHKDIDVSDLAAGLQMVENMFRGATKGLFSKIDEMTFKMTLNGLKSEDYEAISITPKLTKLSKS